MAEAGTLPKRGSKACQYCGCQNSNRAYTCKSCHRPLKDHVASQQQLKAKQSCVDVSKLIQGDKPERLFSVRIRQRGPDYRTFVSVSGGKHWQCHYAPCAIAQEARLRSSATTGSLDSPQSGTCEHIQKVYQDLLHGSCDSQEQIELDRSLLSALPFPQSIKEKMQEMSAKHANNRLIQRVSDETFLLRNAQCSQEHQFGVLHVRLSKAVPPTFHCPCNTYRRYSSVTAHSGGGTTPRLSKRCQHFYLCLWAIASDVQLSAEFSHFLSKEHAGRWHSILFDMINFAELTTCFLCSRWQ